MFERILLPLDGSVAAEAILPLVRKFAAKPGRELILLRAGTDDGYLYSVVRRLSGLHVRVLHREGPPAEAILAAADELRPTLIAMTTHGRTGLARFALGSVAEKVARDARLPLLLVRSFEPAPKDWIFKRLLVPMDGSDRALGIVAPATAFALEFGAEITILHVSPDNAFPPGAYTGQIVDRPHDPHPRLPANAPIVDVLRFAGERFAEANLTTSIVHLGGDPAAAILDYAREHLSDLVAMSTHGRSGPTRWVLGSVTEKVLRHATMPLLVASVRM